MQCPYCGSKNFKDRRLGFYACDDVARPGWYAIPLLRSAERRNRHNGPQRERRDAGVMAKVCIVCGNIGLFEESKE